jgi:hypothetical protein
MIAISPSLVLRGLLPRHHLQTANELRVTESHCRRRAVRYIDHLLMAGREDTPLPSRFVVKAVRCHDFERRQATGRPDEIDVFIH